MLLLGTRTTVLFTTMCCLAVSLTQADDGVASAAPGRPVKVAAIAIGFGGEWDAKMKLASEHLEAAGKLGVDIACLPEEFAGMNAEPQNGPTTQAIGAIARKHGMYVVCPIREQADDGKQYNTAVLLGRDGQIVGYYRKVFVFWGEELCCGREGVKTFDLDFGRVAMLTCFDANFDEVWQEAERKDVEIVLWPSAYGGGMPLNGYAMIHNYNVVAVGFGNIIDVFGRNIEQVESPLPQQFVTTLDLDLTIVHLDFNAEKVERLLAEHGDEIERLTDVGGPENWYVLRATKPGVRVRDLCREYELETLREYRQRSREQINELRMAGKPVPMP
jgi:hypothetical protein